jgi:hypothetical protein
MTVRSLKQSDIPALRAIAQASGLEFPDVSAEHLVSVLVVADDRDRPIMAAAAQRSVQIRLWCGAFERPHAKMFALRLLQDAIASVLRSKGFSEANAFLPPSIAKKFSKRLEKSFGWVQNWSSWNKQF